MAADRRRHPRELPGISDELQDLIDALPPKEQELNRVFWRDISGYAIENAKRLDRAYAVIEKIRRLVAVALTLIVLIMAGAGVGTVVLLSKSNDTLNQVQQGRHVSLGVTCATLSAVAQAGRIVISGSKHAPDARQERALETLGFPPFKAREKQAELEAKAYVASISRAVDAQIGRKGDGLVLPNGTINCLKLSNLAQLDGHGNLSTGQLSPPRK